MSKEANKRRIRDWVIALNKEEWHGMEALLHDQFIDHNPFPGQTPDKAGYAELIRKAHQEWFPGYQITIKDILAEDDKVTVRVVVDAIHTKNVLGAAPSGKPIHWEAIGIYRFQDGQIIERWELIDSMSFLAQLGLVDVPDSLQA